MKKFFVIFTIFTYLLPTATLAQADFNPNFIISDSEMQNTQNWTRDDIQRFLENRGSYLSKYRCEDFNGVTKSAADIIYDAALNYQINPKFLVVNLQKEQSLITDDSPSQKQLDWAMGYAVCDSCSMSDPKIQKYKGFGKQVDNAAALIRWYYNNSDKGYIKKKDVSTIIDDTTVIPQSWATAFLYTYTPHLHGNQNFWRIWQTWFAQVYPGGSLLKAEDSSEIWLIQDGKKRKFKNQTALVTRFDPNMVIEVPGSELSNYTEGPQIALPNYAIVRSGSNYYLLDYDYKRPFENAETVGKLGFNPDEVIDVSETDLAGFALGPVITANSTPPQGVIYQITDSNNSLYLLKDGIFYPITDKSLVDASYKNLRIEKHKKIDLQQYKIIFDLAPIKDGTLLQEEESNRIYVIEKGKKRLISDNDTFVAMGYKKENVFPIDVITLMTVPDGEPLYLNANLLSSRDKYLGDSEAAVTDIYGSKLPAYLVAEYPSGRIISGKNIDTKRPMAALTKILVALESVNQSYKDAKVVTYSVKKYNTTGSALKMLEGEKLTLKDAFNAMLVGSANNMARLLAQNSGLSTEDAFIKAINKRLDTWGVDNTQVVDTTGLSAKNVSTPRDLLKIFVTKALKNTQIKEAIARSSYTFKETLSKDSLKTRTVKNTNQLSTKGKNYKILASKTGYTEDAGSILMMLIESTVTKKQYIILTMGEKNYANRFVEPNKIAEWIASGKVKITATK